MIKIKINDRQLGQVRRLEEPRGDPALMGRMFTPTSPTMGALISLWHPAKGWHVAADGWLWTPRRGASFGPRPNPRRRMLLGPFLRPKAWCSAPPFPPLAMYMPWTPWTVPSCGQLHLVPAFTVVYPSATLVSSWEMGTATALVKIPLTHPPRALLFLPSAYKNQPINNSTFLEFRPSKFRLANSLIKTVCTCVSIHAHLGPGFVRYIGRHSMLWQH